jgi:serine/threonine protein kinase/predicted lipoprotein with Yx(FWY)xxD motif
MNPACAGDHMKALRLHDEGRGGVLSEDFPALTGFRPGSLVAGYRLEAQVGAGGMAVVFRARDERLGRLVALKILASALAADGVFRRRFIAESRAAAAVDDPHIIPVYEAGETAGVLFIAMRFVAGGDLRLVLEREGALRSARAAAFISPVALALDAAHGAGLVHRDVKPANILVDVRQDRPDHVYLSDFGVSKGAMSSVSLTGPGQFLGTPDYSAPEQIQGHAVNGRADQYALACVAYQLLTGTVPFERDQGMAVLLAHLSQPPPSLRMRRPDLPPAADEVLAKALAKVPEKRYGSCRDFADALREALGLAPYDSLGSASSRVHPQYETAAPRSGFSRSVVTGTGKVAASADPAVAVTIDSMPDGGSAAATDFPSEEVGTPHRRVTLDQDRSRYAQPPPRDDYPPVATGGAGTGGKTPQSSRHSRTGRAIRRRTVIIAAALGIAVSGLVIAIAFISSPPGKSSAGPNTLRTARISGVTVLTDAAGFTLYWFAPDTPTLSKCSGSCASYWPPLKGPVAAGPGVTGKLGTITRPDGSVQATYEGHPLYTYIGDAAAGHAYGNGLDLNGGIWHEVIVPSTPGSASLSARGSHTSSTYPEPALGNMPAD